MKVAILSSKDGAERLRGTLTEAGCQVAWVAHDSGDAIQKARETTPDLLLMDLELPGVDAVESTRRIMTGSPCAIVLVTTAKAGTLSSVYDAMGAGALDTVCVSGPNGERELLSKVTMVRKLVGRSETDRMASQPRLRAVRADDRLPNLVVMGASTGGPQAVATIVESFPPVLDAAVVLAQHFDRHFAPGFVEWLAERAKVPVELVKDGEQPRRGCVQIAATNDHVVMNEDRTLSYTPHPRAKPYRPSVDIFFESVAAHWPRPSIAVLLTGMGRDGAHGLLALKRKGWMTIAQDESSSVVYGMPRAAVELGAAMRVIPVSRIGAVIVERTRKAK
jgi:two-component system response regulator WspF